MELTELIEAQRASVGRAQKRFDEAYEDPHFRYAAEAVRGVVTAVDKLATLVHCDPHPQEGCPHCP